jgi:hypothetical protein
MRSTLALTLGCLAATTLFAACSGGSTTKDAAVTMFSCQEIRMCIASGCGDGQQACVDDCVAKGSADGKATFQALAACTATPCPAGDFSCICEQTCFADGVCLTQTEACVGTLPSDLVCDESCH